MFRQRYVTAECLNDGGFGTEMSETNVAKTWNELIQHESLSL